MEPITLPVLIFYGAEPENLLAVPALRKGPYSNSGQGYVVSEAKENFERILKGSLSSYLEKLLEVGKTFNDLPQEWLPDSGLDDPEKIGAYFSKKVSLDDRVVRDSEVELPTEEGLPTLKISYYRLASIPENRF